MLRFSTARWDLASTFIRWRTESKISHVELWDSVTGETLGARLIGGVKVRQASEQRKQINVVLVPVQWAADAWLWIIRNELGRKYDLEGIFGIVTSHGEADRQRCFCSELIAKYLHATAQFPWNLSPQATTPRDLLVMYFFPTITKGVPSGLAGS